MFVKIDHIAYCGDLDLFESELLSLGYECKFREHNIYNSDIKKKYLQEYTTKHDLSIYAKEGFLGLELLKHNSISDANDSYIGNVDLGPEQEIELLCSDTEQMESFLKIFGIKRDGTDLNFYSVVDREPTLFKLKKVVEKKNYRLDACGYNCVAFWVMNLIRKVDLFVKNGYFVTEIDTVEVNNKQALVAYVLGPDGQPFELIELRKNKNENS